MKKTLFDALDFTWREAACIVVFFFIEIRYKVGRSLLLDARFDEEEKLASCLYQRLIPSVAR